MFDNIGGKIKGYAKIVCWLGILGSVFVGVVFSCSGSGGAASFIAGILIAIIGSISSWIGSFLTYGFGQLIENSDILVEQGNMPAGTSVNSYSGMEDHNMPKSKTVNTFDWQPAEESTALIVSETNIRCENCHRIQFIGNESCSRCGAKFTEIKK